MPIDQQPSEIVDKTVVLDTLEAFCTRRNYFALFEDAQFGFLPPSISMQIASFFVDTTEYCQLISINAKRFKADSFIVDFGHYLGDFPLWDYRILAESYDRIIKSAVETVNLLDKTYKTLEETR